MNRQFFSTVPCKRLYALAFVMVVCAVTLAIPRILKSSHQRKVSKSINEEICARIKEGMSREEVILLIGDSNGCYNSSPVVYRAELGFWTNHICERYNGDVWTGDDGEIIICFGEADVVRHAYYRSVVTDKRNLIEKLRDVLVGQW